MKNYIFDFDGTLGDSKKCSVLATQAAYKALDLVVPSDDQIAHYMGIPIEISFVEMASEPLDDATFEQLLTTFRAYYKQFEQGSLTLFPDVVEVLTTLYTAGKPLFVVSSKSTAVLLRNLQALNIAHFFTAITGADDVSHYKPHPEGILQLVERFNLDKNDTLMIGDAIFDLQMAHAAGVASCGVSWGSHGTEKLAAEHPTYLIHDMKGLLTI